VASIDCEVAKFASMPRDGQNPRPAWPTNSAPATYAWRWPKEKPANMFNDKKVVESQLVAPEKGPGQSGTQVLRTEAKVTITTKAGKKYSAFVNTPKGDPRNPPTDKELEDKFRTLAAFVLPRAKIDRLVKAIWNLDKMKNIRQLIRLCY
jgi:2-methylcitrate dehydratase